MGYKSWGKRLLNFFILSPNEYKDFFTHVTQLTPGYFQFLGWLIILGALEYAKQKTNSLVILLFLKLGVVLFSLSFTPFILYYFENKFSVFFQKVLRNKIIFLLIILVIFIAVSSFLEKITTQIAPQSNGAGGTRKLGE